MPEIVLEIKGLSYTYPDGNEALRNLDLRIEKGSKVFFHGANGAGKTTFFQCVNGLLKPKDGEIRIDGNIVPNSVDRMKRIGIVFQNAADQIVSGSVFDEIAFGPLNRGLSEEEVDERVRETMELLNIEHLRNRPPHFLSYGEMKRVCIAAVLSMRQEIVILDEPASGVDARQADELVDILNRLADEGRTLLISTHDADFSWSCADRIVVLDRGELLCEGKHDEVFAHSGVLEKARLNKPMLMEVYEKMCKYLPLEQESPPRNLRELERLLERNAPC